ncbi:MAG: methylated-DNA--[protein]-cysteine S-methyltransferase [Eubacteriales bacterium]|nr:methylated-DNA--[protein]-cysteine S-methyltransferase [Eubacteriales bacterium]
MPQAAYTTEFGRITISYNHEAITGIRRSLEGEEDGIPGFLSDSAFTQLQEYFMGKRKVFHLPLAPVGTTFQRKVWEALYAIPYGETRAYRDIAATIGEPRAYRAVGMANNRNPIMIVIPCHRVIGAHGELVGYGGGLDMKEALLTLERRNSVY